MPTNHNRMHSYSTYRRDINTTLNVLFFVMAFAIMLARAFLYLGHMPLVHMLCLAGKMALIPIAAILTIRTPGKPAAIDIGLILYGSALYISCFVTHTQVLTLTLTVLDVFIFWAMCRWFFVRQSLFPLKAVTLILFAFITLNFLLVLWKPEGLWHYATSDKMYYLLGGNYNNMGKAIFVAILTNFLLVQLLPQRDVRMRRFYRSILISVILMALFTLLYMGSMTSLVGVLLLLSLFSLILLRTRWLRVTAIIALIAVYGVLQTWAVFRDMETPSPQVEHIVQDVLKKDMTFSLRTHVWERAKRLIEREPVFGYGEHDDQWYQEELEGLNTHNLVLHILLRGGWVSLATFILFLLIIHVTLIRDAIREKSHRPYILIAGLWVFLFMMIFEVYSFFAFSILFIYASQTSLLAYAEPFKDRV